MINIYEVDVIHAMNWVKSVRSRDSTKTMKICWKNSIMDEGFLFPEGGIKENISEGYKIPENMGFTILKFLLGQWRITIQIELNFGIDLDSTAVRLDEHFIDLILEASTDATVFGEP